MKTINNRYEYDPGKDFLGKGGFARVYRARDTLLHRDVALKLFNNNGDQRYSVLEEIRKAIGLEHPNLLRYYDVVLQEGENQFGEIEQTQIGIMELANAGDLKDFARNNPGSPLLYKLLKEVLQGLEYLHGKGIIHRDLKAQNILLVKQDGQLTAKISDFGISKDMAAGGQSVSMMAGTPDYMAPEQFAPAKYGIDGKIASNLDLWSFGIMVHELLTNSSPFGSRDGNTTLEQIMEQFHTTDLTQEIERLSEPYKSVVKKCLVVNARERIRKASELIGHFEGPGSAVPATPSPEDGTKVYPQGGTAASRDDDATKVYPKGGPAAQATRDDDATKIYPKEGGSDGATSADADASALEIEKHESRSSAFFRNAGFIIVFAVVLLILASPSRRGVLVGGVGEKISEEQVKQDAADKMVMNSIAMINIPAGSFKMGSDQYDNEVPVHTVRVPAFLLGKTEVTEAQWRAVMGKNPTSLVNCEECPVVGVDWDDVQKFLAALNAKTGQRYRLPSEAEWEYACRAGGKHRYCGGNDLDAVAWHGGNSKHKAQPVGTKLANKFGLHDMSGNAREWVQDCGNKNYRGAPSNGQAWESGDCSKRIQRGSSWYFSTPDFETATGRNEYDVRDGSDVGFRLARTLP
jgi:formylglycine-generating enzyme required for sulfatase activity/tRNA A-37 threonylcarbamoyl transferase component Bud32